MKTEYKQFTQEDMELMNMSKEEREEYLGINQVEIIQPMSPSQVITKTGILGKRVIEYLTEMYPGHIDTMMMENKLYPFVKKRVEEAKTQIQIIYRNYIQEHQTQQMDFMETVTMNTQAMMIAQEIVLETIICQPVDLKTLFQS